ncbi:hypothetical protein [Pseudobowmanella zhangzhouensis]|uniref:Phosphate-selective porin O and P n=1 Tax=Pseudobowmanella zhangzhouensis TaxID=1537679 RepID=A0ABW1XI53_9ALTE
MRLLLILSLVSSLSFAQQSDSDDWGDDSWDTDWAEQETGLQFTGFIEGGLGGRLQSSALHSRQTLSGARVRIESQYSWQDVRLTAKGDVGFDGVQQKWQTGWRELSAQTSLGQHLDLKLGRQVLTWGTGDYVFLNDLFPKDWLAFFASQDDEYLKAPADAVRLTAFHDWANLDIAWMPEFTPDNYINGEVFSFFSPWAGITIAPGFHAETPNDDEWALRLYKTLNGTEWALYGYQGYEKSPKSLTVAGLPYFAPLTAWGGSVRLPVGDGLFNFEFSRHRSTDDNDGHNPRISNSKDLVLIGYEWELVTRLTAGVQLYLEHTNNHGALLAASPFPQWESNHNRSVLTNRLTWRDSAELWTLSLFSFYSLSDKDFYLRPSASYRLNDQWRFSAGANLFGGDTQYDFFAQFKDNNNVWLRIRYAY